ncbi:transposon Ty3-I Gag-Pol polyprotein [Trichonephila clavipes]|nr:transposon Ty3-I Gag-Pol polyprotein [Trichonephila clavipes]
MVQRHTVSPIQPFAPTAERFQHIDIYLFGPLPPFDGFTFLLTCIDHFTDISTEAVEKSIITNWISRFGVPTIIITDQGG